MNASELKERIKQIDTDLKGYKEVESKIKALRSEKAKLQKQLDNKTLTFEQKFAKWLNKDGGNHETYVPGSYCGYPAYEVIKSHRAFRNENRYETIDVKGEHSFSWMWSFVIGDATLEEMNKELGSEFTKDQVYAVAEEFMKKNLATFKYDW